MSTEKEVQQLGAADPATAIEKKHLDWSDKQRRILSADGNADRFYHSDRGFPFSQEELPHYHLLQGKDDDDDASTNSTRSVFAKWKQRDPQQQSPIVGAWKRPLFYGGWENTTDNDEYTFNLQTRSLFIDLRIPRTRDVVLGNHDSHIQSLEDMNAEQLSYYARQHIFAGYSLLVDGIRSSSSNNNKRTKALIDSCCTRHHCIDWNFVGVPRSRPNKWWVDEPPKKTLPQENPNVWKEWAWATDDHGQHYYCERWERLEGGAAGPVLALRKSSGRDGMLVVVGDHFNYCLDRQVASAHDQGYNGSTGSLVGLVDAALAKNDLGAARAWLSMQGGHGRVSAGWKLDHCIEFWRAASPLWSRDTVTVRGETVESCKVIWKQEQWDVFECSMSSVDEIRELLCKGLQVV